MSSKLVSTLYRTLLRTAKELDASIAARSLCGVEEIGRVAAITGAASSAADPPPSTMFDFVRAEVRLATELCSRQENDYFEAALETIKQMNRRRTALDRDDWEAKPESVAFSVGEILRHKDGFRVAVVGWDASCNAPDAWLKAHDVASMDRGVDQPFYRCFVDTSDGSAPSVVYLAQEDLERDLSGPIRHPRLGRYFERFHQARYLPRADVQARYPEDTVRVPPIHAPEGTMDWSTLTIVEEVPLSVDVDVDGVVFPARAAMAE